jgi:hypothetical protein
MESPLAQAVEAVNDFVSAVSADIETVNAMTDTNQDISESDSDTTTESIATDASDGDMFDFVSGIVVLA